MGVMSNIFVRSSSTRYDNIVGGCIKLFRRAKHDYYDMPKSRVAMPESRTLYTVLKSPHVDKKAREQFALKIRKDYFVIQAERHEMYKKLFWLKRQRIFKAINYELVINSKSTLPRRLLLSKGDAP